MYYNKLKASFIAAIFLISAAQICVAAPIKVVAITTDFASIAKSVGGSLVETQPLVRGSRNLHDIQAKPSMVMKVKDADLLIRLGMKQDSWIDGLIQVSKNGKIFRKSCDGQGPDTCCCGCHRFTGPAGLIADCATRLSRRPNCLGFNGGMDSYALLA